MVYIFTHGRKQCRNFSWLHLGLMPLCHIMAVGDAHVFPGFLTPVQTQLSIVTDNFSHMLQQR